ncbi:MAG: PHP domain-containing protein, partial [Gammaproteobacteria bacterium]
MTNFVHLKVHSEFSLVDGLLRIKPLAKALVAQGVPALAITDDMNLFAAVKVQRAAESAGLKPILGADIWVIIDEKNGAAPTPMTLLVQNLEGYRQLTRLISRAYLSRLHAHRPCVSLAQVLEHNEGLILLSGGQYGGVGQCVLSGDDNTARELWRRIQTAYPDRCYLEVARVGRVDEEVYVRRVAALAADWN